MSKIILYVEDEENDVLLAEIAFARAHIEDSLVIARDGVQAIEYLGGTGSFTDHQAHPAPCLVLLDLRLPHKSGFEVLEWIRQQPEFQSLPVIIYTSSGADSDRERARKLGATDYLVKPSGIGEMTRVAAMIKQRWLDRG
jgi:CheY-like chemotaxis protein